MELIKLSYDSAIGISLNIHPSLIALSIIAIVIAIALKWQLFRRGYGEFKIDEAQIGIGSHSITIKPNDEDLQIAYQLWVELSTRKIGLAIDKDHDVIVEVYDSWYAFFKIARELVKAIPVRKVRSNPSTKAIIDLAFKILNEALREHLTQWQARFRKWYEIEKAKDSNSSLTPQQLQQKYPDYQKIETDMLRVNQILINYKNSLESLINVK